MNQIEIKKKIIELLRLELENKTDFLNNAIDDAQKEAASHKGRMESRYDTFKEEAQTKRDVYKKQLLDIQKSLSVLNEMPIKITGAVQFGSVIETNENNYFISIGALDAVNVDGLKYLSVSPESPLGQILLNKKSGDGFDFRGRKIKIKSIF